MTSPKTPGDFSDIMKLFDPENVAKMFDPKTIMESFGVKPGDLDPKEAIDKAKVQFDAMVKSNEAAVASYRDLMEKQAQIFREVTDEAAHSLQSGSIENAPEVYQAAVRRAFEIMAELSDAVQTANVQAYDTVKGQVEQAIKDLKPKG